MYAKYGFFLIVNFQYIMDAYKWSYQNHASHMSISLNDPDIKIIILNNERSPALNILLSAVRHHNEQIAKYLK